MNAVLGPNGTRSCIPRVLLADDHEEMLKTAAGVVAPHFYVVGAVGHGAAALDVAGRISTFASDALVSGEQVIMLLSRRGLSFTTER